MATKKFLQLFVLSTLSHVALGEALKPGVDFPIGPDQTLTPSAYCDKPDSLRHPERIPYCKRSVDSETKREVDAEYDRRFNMRVAQLRKKFPNDFKTDHLIPLCIGGGNERDNLWPQHRSSFLLTDPIEHKTCELVSLGKMQQKDAVERVLRAKRNLSEARAILNQIESLLGRRTP